MENLKYPRTLILINDLTVGDIAVYPDTIAKRRMLSFNKIGFHIAGAPYTTGDIAADTITVKAGTLDNKPELITIKKSCTDPGDLGMYKIVLDPNCPCDECDYEYSIGFTDKVKEPGVNNQDYKPHYKGYAGKLEKFSCTGGLIDDSYLLAMEDDLIQQINSDAQGWVDAYRFYTVDNTGVTNPSSLTVVLENGTSYVVTAATGLAQQLADAFNADPDSVTAGLYAFTTSTHDIIQITSFLPGVLFTIDSTTLVGCTIVERGIFVKNKDLYRHVYPRVDAGFATVTKQTGLFITATTTAGTTDVQVIAASYTTITGTANDHATEATYATNLNTAMGTFHTTGMTSATGIGTLGVYIWGSGLIDNIDVSFSTASTSVLTFDYSGEGHFPYLTAADVFRLFAERHNGNLDNMTWQEQAVEGAEYCHYRITALNNTVPNLHGASHYNAYKVHIDLYIKKDQTSKLVWDDATPVGDLEHSLSKTVETGTPNTDLDDALGVWAESAITYW